MNTLHDSGYKIEFIAKCINRSLTRAINILRPKLKQEPTRNQERMHLLTSIAARALLLGFSRSRMIARHLQKSYSLPVVVQIFQQVLIRVEYFGYANLICSYANINTQRKPTFVDPFTASRLEFDLVQNDLIS